ncbi:cache domain-containing protein [Mesorhizobium sp. IMUNJ 23232]|uniref:cache domain-containing protein n=1 Tax=Mesorhizobium sp. IMUNJ 23232 TaxID=3376064 RepID=UPI00378DAB20
MRFRRSAPAALIAAVIVVVAALTVLSVRLFGGLTDAVEKSQFELMQAIFDTALRDAENKALARAELLAALPVTRQAVAARDRQALLDNFAAMFEGQKERHSVDQVQFHVPPATSLLRLQDPTLFGDDLSRFRPMVVAVNRDHVSAKGLAIARSGPAIFGVAPVTDMQGNHAGSVEFGLDFAPVLVAMKSAYGLEFSLFIEEKPLRDFATALDPAVFSEQNRVGRFVRLETTNGALMGHLAGDADISVVNEPVTYAREAQGVPFGVLLIPLRDGAGQSLGVVATARDFSGSRAAAGRSLVWQACLAMFAIVILAGAIIVVIRGFLLRPLEVVIGRFVGLSGGGAPVPIEGSERFASELQPLVDLHNRVAAKRAGKPAA